MKNNRKYITLQKIQKRNGAVVPFDENRIKRAIFRALGATGEGGEIEAEHLTSKVLDALILLRKEKKVKIFVPTVETIQDI